MKSPLQRRAVEVSEPRILWALTTPRAPLIHRVVNVHSSLRAKDRNVPVCLNLRWASVAFLPVREKLCPLVLP